LSRRAEIFLKVIAWRVVSITLSFFVIYHFTGNATTTTHALAIGTSVGLIAQWLFEMFWDTFVRSKLRNALSGQQGRIGRLVWWRRDPRSLGVDEHKPGALRGEAITNPLAPENAGREWT
jgi:uncharacterized membrane protein